MTTDSPRHSPTRGNAHNDRASGFSSHVNDCGQVVRLKLDRAAIRAEQRRVYLAGRILAFIAPALIWGLDLLSGYRNRKELT